MPVDMSALVPDALRRRAALMRRPQPAPGVRSPPARLLWRELAALFGGRRPARMHAVPDHVAVRPGPVMLLPGFGAHPARMRPLAAALERAGHRACEWGLGLNLGPTPENFAFLVARIARIAREQGAPVTLVGWSLGGLFARELAKQRPDCVAMVITMGTPFSGDRRANNAWRAYELVTGHAVDDPPVKGDFAVKPPVPTVALWSPRDGIVAPRSAAGWPHERDAAIALRCSHLGFASSPEAIAMVLAVLDAQEDFRQGSGAAGYRPGSTLPVQEAIAASPGAEKP